MRVLIYSLEGDSCGLAWKMQKEGASVDLFIKEKWARPQMEGIVPHVETLEEGLKNKPDYILFDLNKDGAVADKLRSDGWKVVGGSKLADQMEFDRAWGVKLCEQYGIPVPRTESFKDVGTAIAFVKAGKKPYAVKMDANAGGEAASYVAKDTEDMVDYLTQQKESGKINGNKFILQEVVHGAEISTELWFSDGNPTWPANSTLEDKHFLAGGLGQRTGCEVSLVYHYEGAASRLVDKTIRKLFPLLKYSRYSGCLDVNCIVSEKDHEPYFLEFTPRIGYSAIYAYMAILGIPISEYFRRIALGYYKNTSRGTFTTPFKALWGSSLKISIPPYPVQIEPESASEETYGLQQGVKVNGEYGPDFVPIDVQKGSRTALECAGTTGIIGEALGRGNSILEAWRSSQRVFKSVECPNQQGRYTDGIDDIWKRALKLKTWGYEVPNISGAGVSPTPGRLKPAPALLAK
jgi:phosphoribosylamine--glycine ligase